MRRVVVALIVLGLGGLALAQERVFSITYDRRNAEITNGMYIRKPGGGFGHRACGVMTDGDGGVLDLPIKVPCVECETAVLTEAAIRQACGPKWLEANGL